MTFYISLLLTLKICHVFSSIYALEIERVNTAWVTFHLMNIRCFLKVWPSF